MANLLDLLVTVGLWLFVPIALVCAWDSLFEEPKRPVDASGEAAPPSQLVRVCQWLLWPAGVAAFMGLSRGGHLSTVLGPVSLVLTVLAVPVALVAAYDRWVLQPKRPRDENGRPAIAPAYVRIALLLLPFALIAVVFSIGPAAVFDLLKQIAEPLSWFAAPVALWCAFDSWFLAPRRQIAAGTTEVPDPALVRVAYFILPVLIVAVIVRMISAEKLDFSLVLFALSVATGVVWGLDHFWLRRRREAAATALPKPIKLAEPGTVDYARSFFPVAIIVLVVRSFIFEPFRIPSDSMMPTLLDGDFIVVSKYSYGLRLPVLNSKVVDTGTPQRGDIVVFRFPPDPNVNYIKRLVGLPGDRVEVRGDQLIVNGVAVPQQIVGDYTDGCYVGMTRAIENLGGRAHEVLSCRAPGRITTARDIGYAGGKAPPAVCNRAGTAKSVGSWVCLSAGAGATDFGDHVFEVVPAGHYLMIGDNRDNSEDSRVWGFVPDENLVGKATRIWFNLDLQRPQGERVNIGRIGDSIE
jgi:signal peptidase I